MTHVSGEAITLTGLWRLMHRNAVVERQLDAATGAFQSVLEDSFALLGLDAV